MSGSRTRSAVVCFLLLPLAGTFPFPAHADAADGQRARIERIEASVLAPCCYTEPVSIHQSEIAVKMRLEIAKWVAAGRTDREILDTYVQAYGSKVLVDPRTIPAWWTPWIPWLTVILAMGFGFWLLRHWRAKPAADVMPSVEPVFAALPDFDEEE